MRGKILKKLLTTTTILIGLTSPVLANSNITIVGSSTVFPFSSTVSEAYSNKTGNSAPIVESTGSGGGFKLFCNGIGSDQPDITNASRAIKSSELQLCKDNGVTPLEVKIGFDGIVLATSGEPFNVSLQGIYLALSKYIPSNKGYIANTNKTWNEINKDLPNMPIDVLGPPPTSGTRDAFLELAMEVGCVAYHEKLNIKLSKKDKKEKCHSIREDGVFVEAGENDNLIVNKLVANNNRIGIFGFSFLDNNMDKVTALSVENVFPEFENIADKSYPISRSLYFYVKQEHLTVKPNIKKFVQEFVSESSMGDDGYLVDKGLIPLSSQDRIKLQDYWK